MNAPYNWKHKSGYRINNDGMAIKYEHMKRPFVAVIEGIDNEYDGELEYYTVIFDQSVTPMEMIEGHEIFRDKETAMNHLEELMEEYN